MLRLAEEYAAVRGRAQLDARMHELLPDAGVVMPGDLHTKLLSLNWSDVYTTNYDTLLERALDTDRREFNPEIERRYQVVVAANDVPFSKANGRPRVVKLHGSLRTGSRLIVTEDDYRSYPTDFAPFVNMVQQSMLENVFCLIGFSGDDPNFLLWTGWVRDRLGSNSPPIYLITLKAASEGERLILQRRNVFPINIASLGSRDGKTDHAASLNALLNFWKDKPPPRQANWPFHNPANKLRSFDLDVANLVGWVTLAQRNRNEYPGWLIAPADNRLRLGDASATWRVIGAYRKLPADVPHWFRVVILTEVLWILDTMLAFPVPHVAEDIATLVRPKIQLDKHPPMPQLPELGLRLRPSDGQLLLLESRLLIALLKSAREDGDSAMFKQWTELLDRKIPPASRSLGDSVSVLVRTDTSPSGRAQARRGHQLNNSA
ncbi:SIR2 family NAD-dependent protein deacylase [Paraburkholderia strydomiana]|uniref:SIR2 family protein n=1 Tax=Paraburkholderia strydomiana TaxID=1245417 RepID=A0ABW9BY46_9BURK